MFNNYVQMSHQPMKEMKPIPTTTRSLFKGAAIDLNSKAQHITMDMTKNEMLDHPKVVDAIVSGALSSFDTKSRICEVINGRA